MESRRRSAVIAALAFAALASSQAHSQTQLFELVGSGTTYNEQFGMDVDVDGNRAIVGCSTDSHAGIICGSVFLFDTTTGVELFRLVPSAPQNLMQFGYGVAIEGNRAVVGAHSANYSAPSGGAAFVYDTTTGQELAVLVPSDNASADHFGVSVAIDGDWLLISAPGDTPHGTWSGSVYVYSLSTGQQLRKLVPSNGQAYDNFGCRVAVSGQRAVVGAFYRDTHGYLSGSAYVFDVTTGVQLFELSPADGAAEDYFGWRLDLDDDLALIGAYQDDDQGANSGAAYLFDVTTGVELRKLVPGTPGPDQLFGYDVSLTGGIAVVGVPEGTFTGSSGTGRAYTFDAFSGEELGLSLANNAAVGDLFGFSVAFDGVDAIFGAPGKASFRGSGYLFDPLPGGLGFCYGDPGSGTPCPCGNDNDGSVPGSGCANGAFASGARLTGSGFPRVSADTLVLTTTGLDPNNSGLYFQANNKVNGGDGLLFGDGLRCAGGGLIRLQVRSSNSAGVSSTTLSIAAKGGVAPGDRKFYQCWYRDTSGMQPCGAGVYDFNLSNGFEVSWRP